MVIEKKGPTMTPCDTDTLKQKSTNFYILSSSEHNRLQQRSSAKPTTTDNIIFADCRYKPNMNRTVARWMALPVSLKEMTNCLITNYCTNKNGNGNGKHITHFQLAKHN